MEREELIKILDFENGKPDEMGTDWVVVSRGAALRAMVAAYNRGVSDAVDKMLEATILGTEVRYNDLKIGD